ncbi:MAG: tRNA (adenosine(37)-N6)-threonylcarbamoyltransferase complex dimerization subunit type 1 TsaB [Acetanaerobacterium sp.]
MLILGLDTSAGAGSVAVCDETRVLGEFFINTKLTHSQTLMPMVQALLESTQLSIADIDAYAVASGPGSFTGLRIGIAAVKGMAMAAAKPCAGVSTLQALAYNLRGFEGVICPAMDARCNQVYTALFCAKDGGIDRLSEDGAMTVDELAHRLSQFDEPVFLVGDGASLCYNKMSMDIPGVRLAPEHLVYQRAAAVCRLGLEAVRDGKAQSAQTLAPNYLRLPQAERELRARNLRVENMREQ